jgi:hypothetical protein
MQLRLLIPYVAVLCLQIGAVVPDVLSQEIIHIENRRMADMEGGISMTADLQANAIQNKNEILQSFNSVQVQYQSGIHTLLTLASYNISLVNDQRVINDSYQHLRYTRTLDRSIAFESFLQSQHNEGIQLQWRGLAGAGPRFTVAQRDSVRLFLGTLYMYEYERERESGLIHRDHRLSSYVSFGTPISRNALFDLIVYYQPNLQRFTDYKFSSQVHIEIALGGRFSLLTAISMTHNTRPPENIRRTNWSFKNGIRITV